MILESQIDQQIKKNTNKLKACYLIFFAVAKQLLVLPFIQVVNT